MDKFEPYWWNLPVFKLHWCCLREPHNRPRRTHRVSGGIAQLFLNLGTRRGCVVSITPPPPLPPGKTGTHCTGGWVGPGAGPDRCGKSRPTGI
jgi:hypothetical protein